MTCLFGHKFIKLGEEIICERCGKEPPKEYARNVLGKIKKAQIVSKKDIIDQVLEDDN